MKLVKTEAGQQAFKERSAQFSSRQRAAFILFDGNKTVAQVLAATSGLGMTADDVEYMVNLGFLQAPAPVPDLGAGPSASPAGLTKQQRYFQAKIIAIQSVASLGLKGFRLNKEVEETANYDQLLDLLPKITEAIGPQAAQNLRNMLVD
jgi:hypothetical protein